MLFVIDVKNVGNSNKDIKHLNSTITKLICHLQKPYWTAFSPSSYKKLSEHRLSINSTIKPFETLQLATSSISRINSNMLSQPFRN